MNAITYINTMTNIPHWEPIHQLQSRGYAYENAGYYLHIYGREDDLWVLSTGLTASEVKQSSKLDDWAIKIFGAKDIQAMQLKAGEVINGVWRPGLYYADHIYQALSTNENEQRKAEQALRILLDKLDDILLYIEPSISGIKSYGHKTRELLILACTEVENFWIQYMQTAKLQISRGAFTTNDYVKLAAPLFLPEYEILFKWATSIQPILPFASWDPKHPTQSLSWYDAYNKTKHDRNKYFPEATLHNCFAALSAAIVMFCVRYSPFPLIHGNSSLSAIFNQHFSIKLVNPDVKSFYVPLISLPPNYSRDLVCGDAGRYAKPWVQRQLVL